MSIKKYKHPGGYTIEYDSKKFTMSPNGTLFANCLPELDPKNIEKTRAKAEKERLEKEIQARKEIHSRVGQRLLVKASSYGDEVVEKSILEVSPSGDYVRIMDHNGKKTWVTYDSIKVKEVLSFKQLKAVKKKK
jgi:hypothetical protein